jgi:hypothetical protein
MVPVEEKKTYIGGYLTDGGRKIPYYCDAIELDPRYEITFKKIDDEVSRALLFHPRRNQMGFTHTLSVKKREILWRKYGIDWHPSSEFNPGIRID